MTAATATTAPESVSAGEPKTFLIPIAAAESSTEPSNPMDAIAPVRLSFPGESATTLNSPGEVVAANSIPSLPATAHLSQTAEDTNASTEPPEPTPPTTSTPDTSTMANIATVGFISKAGWIVSAGHALKQQHADTPALISLRGMPALNLPADIQRTVYAHQPNLDLLLANVKVAAMDLSSLLPAHLAVDISNAPDKPVIHVQWYDRTRAKQTESVPIVCESALVHVVVIRNDKPHAMRVSLISVDTIKVNQDHDKTVQLSNYISVNIPGGTLQPGNSGSPLVLTTGSGQHVVLGFVRGVFKSPLIGAGNI